MALGQEGLGRGLQDVLAKTMRRDPPRGYLEVEIGLVVPPSKNPRQDFDQSALDELASSISQHGMMQPIVVLRKDVGYEVVSGERRYRAAKQAGLTKIPVVVRDETDPRHLAELRLVENLQRQDLNPVELAEAYQVLLTDHQLTHDELATRLNKTRPVITNTLRLLSLPDALRAKVRQGALSLGHAKALLACSDPAWQVSLAERIQAEGLSVREAERLASNPAKAEAKSGGAATDGSGSGSRAAAKAPHLRELEENLRLLFNTTVTIQEQSGGKGSMTLRFHNRDHFQRMVGVMARALSEQRRNTPGSPSNPGPGTPPTP
jgi:ParB family chromosome partitioning protein